jgi:hypothetical protein
MQEEVAPVGYPISLLASSKQQSRHDKEFAAAARGIFPGAQK